MHAFDEGEALLRDRDRIPAQRRDRQLRFDCRRRTPTADVGLVEFAPMGDGRLDAIEPTALVRLARCGEGRAAELFRIEPIRAFLGEFRPTGSAPGKASVSNPFPKPVRYCGEPAREAAVTARLGRVTSFMTGTPPSNFSALDRMCSSSARPVVRSCYQRRGALGKIADGASRSRGLQTECSGDRLFSRRCAISQRPQP